MKKLKLFPALLVTVMLFSSCIAGPPAVNSSLDTKEDGGSTPVSASDTKEYEHPIDGTTFVVSKNYPLYYSIPDTLIDTVVRFKGKEHVDRFEFMYSGTEQYGVGAFCEYFGIDYYTYVFLFEHARRKDNIGYLSRDDLLLRKEESEQSDYVSFLSSHPEYFYSEYFGRYYDSSVFLRSDYSPEHDGMCIKPDFCTHTSYYHIIDSYMIEAVGYDEYIKFESAYGGTEEYNVVNFVEKYGIDRARFDEIYDGILPTYNPEYLYADAGVRSEYFETCPAGVAFGIEDATVYRYNGAYGAVATDLFKGLIPDGAFDSLREQYGKCRLPIGLVCEYYGVTEQEYRAACEASDFYKSNKENIETLRRQISEGTPDDGLLHSLAPYLWELHFGAYADNAVFYNNYYDSVHERDLYLPPEKRTHVSLYYRIDDRLLDYVGAVGVLEFADKFGGTEKFNIVNFLSYFNISELEYEDIILSYYFDSDVRYLEWVMPYPTHALYGAENNGAEFFAFK